MYRLFSTLLLAVPLGLLAQTEGQFQITGKLKGFHAGKVYLGYMKKGQRVLDSCLVMDDTYHFTGTIDESGMGIVADTSIARYYYPRNVSEIFMMPETFTITHIDSFSNTTITGSKVNTELEAQHNALKVYTALVRPISKEFEAARVAGNTALAATLDKRIDSIYDVAKEEIYGSYLKSNPHSPLALMTLQRYAGGEIDPKKILPLFESLSDEAKNSTVGKAFRERIENADKMAIGKDAIDFTQNDTAGHPVKLSSFRGKYVLLDFWASWCVPCREENPNVVKAYGKYHPRGFEVVSVSLDRPGDKDKWLKAIHDDKLTWTNVSDLQFWSNAVAQSYGIQAVPQNFLIDPQGKIVGRNLRGEELEKKLDDIYKE